MKDFKKGGFGGGSKGGFDRGGFRGGSRDGGGFRAAPRGDSFGPKEMYEATCAQCSKRCEVPFRPNGKKPVYCKDCFAANRPEGSERSFSPRSDSPRPSFRSPERQERRFEGNERGGVDMKAQIDAINTKLDALTRMVSALQPPGAPAPAKTSSATRKSSKKVAKK